MPKVAAISFASDAALALKPMSCALSAGAGARRRYAGARLVLDDMHLGRHADASKAAATRPPATPKRAV